MKEPEGVDVGGRPKKQAIDPRRVFIPVEKRNLDGSWVFRTLDGEKYRRDENGVIRKVVPPRAV
jgi:hypothetical protein